MALGRRNSGQMKNAIWPGFVDAMTGLLLVLMFVLTIFMVVQFVLRETISGQASELDALSAEVAALADALGLERQTVNNLRGEISGLNATIGQAQTEAEQQAALIASLRSARAAQDAALADAQELIRHADQAIGPALSALPPLMLFACAHAAAADAVCVCARC